MFEEYSIYSVILFAAAVIVALIIDLYAHKSNEAITMKSAAKWTTFWIALSLLFSLYIFVSHGSQDFSLFITGYLLEKSLSVDNLFVMMAIFAAFSIPDQYQHRVLYYGILGALVLRMVFIALGSSLFIAFGKYALAVFGLVILWSAVKMWKSHYSEKEEITDYTQHWAVKYTRKIMPVHNALEKNRFFIKLDGKTLVTPLFLCLICIELADIMFAFDSVPAIIAVTQKPFLIYTSNIFAILGMRSMYFFLAAAKNFLIHLEKAVIVILVYIGLKMLVAFIFDYHLPVFMSLTVVIGLLVLGVVASLLAHKKAKIDK